MFAEPEIDALTASLAAKFEEISFIHQLGEQLTVEDDVDTVCRSLLESLTPCIEAKIAAIELLADELSADGQHASSKVFVVGDGVSLIKHFQCSAPSTHPSGIRVNNFAVGDDGTTARVVTVPIQRRGTTFGRMIAIRSSTAVEFGTMEADLMKSAAMMLVVHLVNQRQYQAMQQMFGSMIDSLVCALDAKDNYTCGHSGRVAELAVTIAAKLGFDSESQQRIRMAGKLHDIGKIGVADAVLRKPGRLSKDEFDQIKQHPVLGFEILRGIRAFRDILPSVRHHHESWDGGGYPDGLAGHTIPRDAQILAVADSFDAMTSDRPYRKGMPIEKVRRIFQDGRGKQWAADVVDALLETIAD